jgi:hypothetical protein
VFSVLMGLGYQRYVDVQHDAQNVMQSATTEINSNIRALANDATVLKAVLVRANHVYNTSGGKTLDETTRTALVASIEDAGETLERGSQLGDDLQTALDDATDKFTSALSWPPTALDVAEQFASNPGTTDARYPSDASLLVAAAELVVAITAVQKAEIAWQVEQERIAAEKAAAEAAAAAAAAEEAAREEAARAIAESGGGTTTSAPAPPPEALATDPGFNVEAYVASIAPNAYVAWIPGLCDGFYICGRAQVGGIPTTPVEIRLDPNLREIYSNRLGKSVLTHESAHARQWLYYDGDIIALNEALSGLSGTAAVEYMADCATIVILGYSTGTYTSSCTPDQLAAASLIW